ncbi:MAG: SAM-dependent methyltransferase [Betaproteobacteria bacterium]|nr:SAM-dependent methyltransferase [Betaproteobacteria bacterium]
MSPENPKPRGRLFLLPVPLSTDEAALDTLSPGLIRTACHLSHFLVENPKTARHFLKRMGHPQPMADLHLDTLSIQTPRESWPSFLAPLLAGQDVGLLSEAGCPAIADPGSGIVHLAHQSGIRVIPLTGPSSLLLALMASGLEGQRFAFHGYLPLEEMARVAEIQRLERESARWQQTQLVIETPYRNTSLWSALCQGLHPETRLTLARDLTGPDEWIKTTTVALWRDMTTPELQRIPTVFLWLATPAPPSQLSSRPVRNRLSSRGKGDSKLR